MNTADRIRIVQEKAVARKSRPLPEKLQEIKAFIHMHSDGLKDSGHDGTDIHPWCAEKLLGMIEEL